MKILQINTVVNSGSTGRIAEEIGNLVLDNGWQSYIAYGRLANNSKSKLIKIGNNFDIAFHGVKTRFLDQHGFGSFKSSQNLVNEINQIKPDLIHLHNVHGYYLNIQVLFNYLSISKIPVVWTLHDCWPITGHCAYFDFINCAKWKDQCYECPQTRSYPRSYYDNSIWNYERKKKLFNSIEKLTLVPVSYWLKDILKSSYLNKYRVQVIHNGINLNLFYPKSDTNFRTKFNIKGKFIILGVAANWEERKGLRNFLKLSNLIDKDSIIVLVGLNKKQISILPNNIIGITRTESINELAELYSTADIYLNLTYEDNFPTTNLESLACGTPVITYKTGGSVESVNEEVGFVVEKGDLFSLIRDINIIKEKGKLQYSKECRNRAVQFYNKDDRFADYIQLYESLLK